MFLLETGNNLQETKLIVCWFLPKINQNETKIEKH